MWSVLAVAGCATTSFIEKQERTCQASGEATACRAAGEGYGQYNPNGHYDRPKDLAKGTQYTMKACTAGDTVACSALGEYHLVPDAQLIGLLQPNCEHGPAQQDMCVMLVFAAKRAGDTNAEEHARATLASIGGPEVAGPAPSARVGDWHCYELVQRDGKHRTECARSLAECNADQASMQGQWKQDQTHATPCEPHTPVYCYSGIWDGEALDAAAGADTPDGAKSNEQFTECATTEAECTAKKQEMGASGFALKTTLSPQCFEGTAAH
jgi:hypothetical protein